MVSYTLLSYYMGNPDELFKQLEKGLPTPVGQWSNARLAISGTYSCVKQSAGLLHIVSIDALSNPSLTIYDNASGCSGTIIALIDAGMSAGGYIFDYSFLNGMTASLEPGNAASIRISYK